MHLDHDAKRQRTRQTRTGLIPAGWILFYDLYSQQRRNIQFVALALCSLWLLPYAHGREPASSSTNSPPEETFALPESVPDPIEPFNRVMWAFNRGVMTGIIKPTSRVYRFVVVKPVRTSIGNFGYNLTYPGRLINNLLQGKWDGARDEPIGLLAIPPWGGRILRCGDSLENSKIGSGFRPDLRAMGLETTMFHHAANLRAEQ